jgi:predicted N-acetyltransferase YhbS
VRVQIEVRPLPARDLDAADGVLRAAFVAVLGEDVMADTDLLRTRYRGAHVDTLGGYSDGALAGSIVVSRWGRLAGIGPLSVAPRLWGSGVGSRLVEAATALLDGDGVACQSLFTFAHSPRHLRLYQRFGFWPDHLTAVLSAPVVPAPVGRAGNTGASWLRLSDLPDATAAVAGCARLTGEITEGLDVGGEIVSTVEQKLGDVVLLGDPAAPDAFAVCHVGAGTEAGSGIGFVKFAAVRPGPAATAVFGRLLAACHVYVGDAGAQRLVAGVVTARREAYRQLLDSGFRIDALGVVMHRPPGDAGYDRPGVYVLDDRR